MPNTDSLFSGNTANYISCEEGCFVLEEQLLSQYWNEPNWVNILVDVAGTFPNGSTKTFAMPLGPDAPTICPERFEGTVTRNNTVGNPTHSIGTGGNIGGTVSGRARYTYNFPYPVDLVVRTGSLNGNEFAIIRSVCDEFYRLTGNVNRVSGQNYNNLTFHDSNSNSNYALWYRQVTQFVFELDSENGLSSGFSLHLVKTPYLKPIQCRVAPENTVTTPCGAGTRSQTEQMIARKNVGPSFFAEKPLSQTSAAWEFSSDAGVTWGPAPATHNTVAVAGQNRWRQVYTVPEGYQGWFRLAVRGGMNSTGTTGQYWHDGVFLNTQRIIVNTGQPYGYDYQDTSYYVPVTAGVHTFEFREPSGAGAADIQLIADYRGVEVERRGFVRYSCVDAVGVLVGAATDLNYDGTPFVPRVDEEQFAGVY